MKYMGSKSRIAKEIVPILQKYIDINGINTYIEPFVGGANIIDKIVCKNKIGTDLNKYLIALLNRVKSNESLFEEVPRELYNDARANPDKYDDWEIGNIGFLASYNGRFLMVVMLNLVMKKLKMVSDIEIIIKKVKETCYHNRKVS